ncbi:MAG: hypothetical protein BGN88_00810 [Clostridiales bacterium 43-6]|nr:MAG: hypothetical protein BGN88_00810 [Clostridiales bacterium 43-6]
MNCRVNDLYDKEVISVKDGTKIGNVSDLEINAETGKIYQLVIFGKPKLFGLLGREDDFVILWDEIDVLGEDTVLVNCDPPRTRRKRKGNTISSFLLGK